MSWTLSPPTPATEDAAIEQVRAFLQKISVPRSLFTLIRVQFFNSAVEKLAHNLTAQLTFKLLCHFRIGAASSKDHAHNSVIQPSCRSGIGAGEREIRIVDASTTRGSALALSELQRDGDERSVLTTTDYIQIIPVHVSLIADRTVSTTWAPRTSLRGDEDAEEMIPIALTLHDQKLWQIELPRPPFINFVFTTFHPVHRLTNIAPYSLPPNS